MKSAGIAKLDLPESRMTAIVGSVTDRLNNSSAASPESDSSMLSDDNAAHLLRAANDGDREFLAFRSFDLSIQDDASAALAESVRQIEETDDVAVQLQCFADVLALSADTQVVSSILRKSRGLFHSLERRSDIALLAPWLARYARVGLSREATDPETAALIREALAEYLTPEFIHRVSRLEAPPSGELPLVTIICGLKSIGVAALIDSLQVESDRSARNRLLNSLAPRAPELADDLASYVGHSEWYVVRNVLMLLGHGGPGHEEAVARCIEHDDPRVVREALLALARIGSDGGAQLTAGALEGGPAAARRQAAEALWCYPPEVSNPLVRSALENRRLLREYPDLVRLLTEGAVRRDVPGLEEIFRRFRWSLLMIWNPDRRALGWRALRHLRKSK
jgi:hypothetical protein